MSASCRQEYSRRPYFSTLTNACGMTINIKKTFMLVIDKDRKRRGSMPAPDLRINGERLKTLDINDACPYLGYWGTGNGDMSATREIVREKARVARDLIKSHPLCRTLCTERNRRLLILGSPHRMVAE